jgi:hypothetical protein
VNRFFGSFCKSFGVMLLMLGVALSTISAYGDGPGDPGWGGGGIAVCGPTCANGCSMNGQGYCPQTADICSQIQDPATCNGCHCTQDRRYEPCDCKLKP